MDCAGSCSNGYVPDGASSDIKYGAIMQAMYVDADGDGLGYGTTTEDKCSSATLNYSTNNLDTDDNCASNSHDCNGLCDGTGVYDICDKCVADSTKAGTNYYYYYDFFQLI